MSRRLNQLEGFVRKLLRRRCFNYDARLCTDLNRCLTFGHLLLFSLSCIIGAGVFVLNGRLVRSIAGASTSLAYLFAGIAVSCTAACYAEFATLIPRAGSSYSYTYLMLGELPAFLIGWNMLSDLIVSIAAIAKAFSGTLDAITGNVISKWGNVTFVHIPESEYFEQTPDVVSGMFIVLLMLINLTGAHLSQTVNAVMSFIVLIGLVILIIACFVLGSTENITKTGGFFPFGAQGVFDAAGISIFALSGFEAVCNAVEEAKDPRRDIPITLATSMVIIISLYIPAALGLAFLVPRNLIDFSSPYVYGFSRLGRTGLMWFSAVITLFATGVTKLGELYALPRAFYALARDGLLPSCFAHVSSCTQQPVFSLVFSALITVILAVFIKIQILADFMSIGTIFCYLVVGVDLVIYRYLYLSSHLMQEQNACLTLNDMPADCSDRTENEKPEDGNRMIARKCYFFNHAITLLPHGLRTRCAFKTIFSIFLIAVLLLALVVKFAFNRGSWTGAILTFLCSAVVGSMFLLIALFEPMTNKNAYQTKCMPIAPFVTIVINMLLFTSLEFLTWIRFLVWCSVGLVVYFSYGIWHSKVEEESDESFLLQDTREMTVND